MRNVTADIFCRIADVNKHVLMNTVKYNASYSEAE